MDPVVVREPAIPSLPTSMGCGPGSDSDNSVDTVEFKEWCRVVLDKAKKVSKMRGVYRNRTHICFK